MSDPFTIRFERSGGFTGVGVDKTIDSLKLKKEEIEMLRLMIDHADFFTLPSMEAMKTHPDQFTYKITFETKGKKHTVQFSQTSVPEVLKDLIRYLIGKTRPRK